MSPKKYFNYKKNAPWTEHLQIVAQLGLTMAGSIVFCLFVGRAIDKWLDTRGIFTSIFIILGVIGGAVVVYRQIMEVTESDKKKQPPGQKADKRDKNNNGTT